MNRNKIYIIGENENLTTFQYDNDLPSLPLPKLEDTMKRYYETLKPFGTSAELEQSKKVITEFQNGIGMELHKKLEERAKTSRNWLEAWWENYAYHTLRIPLQPYTVMAMPFLLESAFVPETPEYSLKSLARISYHTLEFWDITRREKLRPASSGGGKIRYSSLLYKRFVSAARIPGEIMDRVETQFKTISEGDTPHHGIITGKGRIFMFDILNSDGTFLSAQQLLQIFQIVRAQLDYELIGDCVPVLTNDDRTNWAKNRKYLIELSKENENYVKLMDGGVLMLVLDENEPNNYADSSLLSISGDYHSKWSDKTSTIISYKNGKMCCIGEHSAYDGTISISYGFFIMLSLMELPEPDWNEKPNNIPIIEEINFKIDKHVKNEIQRVMRDCDERRNEIIVTHEIFDDYGKEFLKKCKLHPDAFMQMAIQLAYYKMHEEFVATYETALMRNYYNGRTETLRSCTQQSCDFVKTAIGKNSKKEEIYKALRKAVDHHDLMMNEARKGNAVDRHLFGLWCVAYDNDIEIPEFYSDPLYLKSGGGGNFVLSTSTLGYTINTGFVGPMVLDGYGIFYGITSEGFTIQITSFRDSKKTSASKFLQSFIDTLRELKQIIVEVTDNCSKL